MDGWRLADTPTRIKHLEEFIREVKETDGRTGENDFGSDEETEEAIKTVFSVLKMYISEGEMEAQLPEALKPLI